MSLHAAIIMDGNGRWANARGLPRVAGHRAGMEAVRRVLEASEEFGIDTLSLYAFSSDNWRRPSAEVSALMQLFREFLRRETARCVSDGVRLQVIGRRDRLAKPLLTEIARAEQQTASGSRLYLRVAVDYSGREAIRSGEVGPDVDLLIRTGGEQRLSDFLLWESAYAELYFTPRMWPDFDRTDLARAIHAFEQRERRFGALPSLGQLGSQDAEQGSFYHLRGDRWLR
jgi:undecaprenyl diphosphate synthase